MNSQDFLAQLDALPDGAAQKRFLQEHAAQLDDDLANALKAQADRFLRSDLSRSLQSARLLLAMAELTGNPLYRALGLLAEANARCLGSGDYDCAIELYDEAIDIYRENGCPVRQARSQVGRIFALCRLSRYDEAQEAGRWASQVLEAHGMWHPLADLTLNLGIFACRQGKDAQSLALYERARELYERLGEVGAPYLPWIDQDRAVSLRNLGQFEASLRLAQAAEEAMARLGQRIEAARARQNRALTYFSLGRYNEALALYDQVRDIFADDGRQRDAILVELFTSDCLLHLRRFGDVLRRCQHVRERFTELGTRYEAAQAILNKAVAFTGLGQYADSSTSLAEARRLFAEEGSPIWIACTDLEIAALLLQQGKAHKALEIAQTCKQVFQRHGMPVRKARACLVAAQGAAALGQRDEALQMATEALAIAEERDLSPLMYQGHRLLGTLAAEVGDVDGAMAEYERALHELERLRGRLMVEFRADFVEDKQVVYEDVIRLCLDSEQPLRALEYAERAKSRSLLDLVAYRLDLSIRSRSDADQPLVQELHRLRADRDRLYRRWSCPEELEEVDWMAADENRQQARHDILALERQITERWHRLLIRNADYASDASLWQVRTEPSQPYLPPDTVLVEYYAARGQLLAFAVTREDARAVRLCSNLSQIQRLIRFLWLNIGAVPNSTPDQVRSLTTNALGLLRQLYKALFAPLASELASRQRLIIVPHGALHYLPFHALYDGTSFLLERHEISYLPAASLLRYCRAAAARAAASGQLVLGRSLDGRLPYAVQEAQTVADLLGDQAYLEEAATQARLREAAPGCRLIHLATHGAFRADNPLFSGLALADGWLSTLDIFDLRLSASLVTLSACQTGRNVVGGGDELLGLMRAFLYAGAASVLLSQWAVQDHAAAQLMTGFYAKLTQGWTKGAALQHAQRTLIGRQDERGHLAGAYAHPYFWAPFFLVGDAGTLDTNR